MRKNFNLQNHFSLLPHFNMINFNQIENIKVTAQTPCTLVMDKDQIDSWTWSENLGILTVYPLMDTCVPSKRENATWWLEKTCLYQERPAPTNIEGKVLVWLVFRTHWFTVGWVLSGLCCAHKALHNEGMTCLSEPHLPPAEVSDSAIVGLVFTPCSWDVLGIMSCVFSHSRFISPSAI